MRIRSTKPEFWRSERIASVSWDARLVLKGLESYVDDNGVGKDDLVLIVADVFARDLSRNPPGTLQKVSEAISHLHEGGLVWRYVHDGTPLLYVSFWESVQRIEKPTKGRYPRPDGTMDYRDSQIRESNGNAPELSGSVPGVLRPGTGEQGNRGTEEQAPSSAAPKASKTKPATKHDAEFGRFWAAYPRKVGKAAAVRRFEVIARTVPNLDQVVAGATRYAEACRDSDPKFIAHPATWLNDGRWEDEIRTAKTRPSTPWEGA